MSFQVTPVYDKLLRGTPEVPAGLYQLQLATAEQLTRLHYRSGMLNTVKARLKVLTTHGYVQSDVVPSRQFRTPFYYALGLAGKRYLDAAGFDLPPGWRAVRQVNQHWLFVEHTLELNDVLISALGLGKVSPNYLASFIHEQALKRTPYKAGNLTLIPDAFLEFRSGNRRLPILLEHDRGTEEQTYFRRRIRAYISFIKSRGYEQFFGTSTITVVFTTFVGEQRVEQMRAWTHAEVQNPRLEQVFCFLALTPPLDPVSVWLRPELLLAA